MNQARAGRRWVLPTTFLAYLALCVALQGWSGATDSGFASVDDEPAHYVTGLMFRDYVAQGFPGSPLDFAKNYYLHYPKVAIGQWPPVFYVLQGGWMLVFGVSTLSVLTLMSVLTAGIATLIFGTLRDELPGWGAWIFGLLFLLLPEVQRSSGAVMTEIPLALFCLLAALQFGRFLEGQRGRHAFGFAAFAILAILTKGNALALGALPPLAIALSGSWRTLRRPALWAAGLLVVLVAAPWYRIALPISASTWDGGGSPTLAYSLDALRFYAIGLGLLAGPALLVLALIGAAARPRALAARSRWAALAALAISLLAMHVVVPSSLTHRHLVLVAPALLLLAAGGVVWIAHTRPRAQAWLRVLPVLLLASFVVGRFELPRKSFDGYRAVAQTLVADEDLIGARMLIVSDAQGEGLFTAALAQSEARPGHVVLRGSKVLGLTTWMGQGYRPLFEDADEMAAFLRSVPVGCVVLDLATRPHQRYPYHDQLRQLLEADPSTWQPIGAHDIVRDGRVHPRALRVYRLADHADLPRSELDFGQILRRDLPGL